MTFNRADDAPGPNAPADAFHIMSGILPAWFHRNPPPSTGVHLIVVGRDGVPTQWQMTEGLAGAVVPQLRRNRSIHTAHGSYYDERRSVT